MIPYNENNLILECIRLKKDYTINHDNIPVLKGIYFSVKKGEIVIIKGKSGAGKSTLIGILGGLDYHYSGSIMFGNNCMTDLTAKELALLRRMKIGIIFQNFNLIPSWTAFENVEAALLHKGFSKSDRHKKVCILLKNLGLGNKTHHLPSELSIGQQQRVAIARVLIKEPELILADEPTGEIDKETSQEIIDYLIAPIKEKKATLVITTHGLFPLKIADRILYLKDGLIYPMIRTNRS